VLRGGAFSSCCYCDARINAPDVSQQGKKGLNWSSCHTQRTLAAAGGEGGAEGNPSHKTNDVVAN